MQLKFGAVQITDNTNILEITVPKEMEVNIPTGMTVVDRLYAGDGVTPSSVALVTGMPGAGKCLGKGTKILMFDGTIKNVEDVIIGDQLMGPDSLPRQVLNTVFGKEELFEISPKKGESWICNRSHVLSLVYSDSKKEHKRNLSIDDYLNLSPNKKVRYKQYRIGIEFNKQPLPFDPYLYGLWLGDGTKNRSQITSIDGEIADYINNWASKNKYNVNELFKRNSNVISYDITCNKRGQAKKINPLKNFFRSSFIGNEKRISKNYLVSDKTDRLKLLAGLIDTDGHKTNNMYEIITKYDGLAEDILFLCRSLGFAAYNKKCTKTIKSTKFSGQYNRIFISGNLDIVPVLLPRKKCEPRKQIKNVLRTGIQVTSKGIGEYFGFEIDGDKLFVLGDFTVTHNTTLMLQLADSLTGQGHLVLYNTGEESLYQIRRVTKRLGLTNGFIVGSDENVDDVVSHVKKLQSIVTGNQKVFLFQDSLQTLHVKSEPGKRGRPLTGSRAQLESLKRLTEWAKTTYGVVFVVGQVNKKGDFAGKNEIKHVIDCHMHLGYELKDNGEEIPCMEMTKNRFGISGLYYNFNLSETGIQFISNR